MEKVKESLRILIQGESDAIKMYSQFRDIAKKEKYLNISTLFDALVMAEKIHLNNHKKALKEKFEAKPYTELETNTTIGNLEYALNGEVEESKKLYPKLIKNIKSAQHSEYGKVAKLSMVWARDVEKGHAKLLKEALNAIQKGNDLEFETISVCQVCGNIVLDKNDDKVCDICGHDDIFFKSVSKVN